jgi:hypothetical protein
MLPSGVIDDHPALLSLSRSVVRMLITPIWLIPVALRLLPARKIFRFAFAANAGYSSLAFIEGTVYFFDFVKYEVCVSYSVVCVLLMGIAL